MPSDTTIMNEEDFKAPTTLAEAKKMIEALNPRKHSTQVEKNIAYGRLECFLSILFSEK